MKYYLPRTFLFFVLAIFLAKPLATAQNTPTSGGSSMMKLGSGKLGSFVLKKGSSPANLSSTEEAKIDAGVRSRIQTQGYADVLISLVSKGMDDVSNSQLLLRVKADVSKMQQSVLSSVPSGFSSRVMYSVIPAMAGKVESEEALEALARNQYVQRIGLNAPVKTVSSPSSTVFADYPMALRDSVPLIGADGRIASGNDGDGVTVAVIDTGIDGENPYLVGSIVEEACFLYDPAVGVCPNGAMEQVGPGAALDEESHGTHVSGIIVANNLPVDDTETATGVAPGAGIVAIKVGGTGRNLDLQGILAGVNWILNGNPYNVKVINLSLGGEEQFSEICDDFDATTMIYGETARMLRSQGIVVVAAAGNDGNPEGMSLPACLSAVLSVGNSDDNDVAAVSTNSNAFTDVFAPGVDIISTGLLDAGGIDVKTGTSMSTPHVVGCAALLIQESPDLTPDEIETRLRSSLFTVTNGERVFPRLDCSLESTPAPTPLATPISETVRGIRLTLNNAQPVENDDIAALEALFDSWFDDFYASSSESPESVRNVVSSMIVIDQKETGSEEDAFDNSTATVLTYDQALLYDATEDAPNAESLVTLPFKVESANIDLGEQLKELFPDSFGNLDVPLSEPSLPPVSSKSSRSSKSGSKSSKSGSQGSSKSASSKSGRSKGRY